MNLCQSPCQPLNIQQHNYTKKVLLALELQPQETLKLGFFSSPSPLLSDLFASHPAEAVLHGLYQSAECADDRKLLLS